MKEVSDYMRSLGFDPGNLEPDGKIHRFQRNGSVDSAWYIGWQNARMRTGAFYYVCLFGDWKTGEKHVYKPGDLTAVERKAIDGQIAEQKKKRDDDLRKLNLEKCDIAEQRYKAAKKNGSTPYMLRKGIPELYGSCIYEDRLQIPMRDVKARLWNLQSIFPDGQKRFMAGARKKGTFHVIGDDIATEAYVCEGFATAASIYQATTGTVIVAFDAGNLLEVVKEVRAQYPECFLTICGDDDRFKEPNVGREKAEKAALLCQGAVVFPSFPANDLESTDFNDLHVRYGLEAVKELLVEKPPERRTGFIPLGYEGPNFYFYNLATKDVVKLNSFNFIQMYTLAPKDYWEANYPSKKGADYDEASHDIVQQCKAVGPFDPSRIRGCGVWNDRGRVVLNTGHNLVVNGRETSLTTLSSHQIYVLTRDRLPPIHENMLTKEEGRCIAKTCSLFRWQNPMVDALTLMGWIANARIAGALPIRPHIWITGSKGSGKSTLMEQFISPLLGGPKAKVHLIGNTTEAGIRQELRIGSRPVIFDEFEPTNRNSRERVDAIIEMARNTWSISQGKVLKGSSGGSSVDYSLNFSALFSSIRVRLENDADRSRFCVLELLDKSTVGDQWPLLKRLLAEVSEETGERLFARMIHYFPQIIECQRIIQGYLAREVTQRYGQQVGTLLGAGWMVENDEPIRPEQAEAYCKAFVAMNREKIEDDSAGDDEQECLLHLTTHIFEMRSVSGITHEMSLRKAVKEDGWREALLIRGIKVSGERVLIANKHSELEKIYRNTRWAGNWARSLKRIDGAISNHNVSFGGRDTKSRCVSIPISLL